ncbi:MAG: diacylglycerol kinase family lipid kinase [Deltaproteobacteria bacterium]|nr:MAG: diacylglycerol kinase family lipid kinase [Deltaproteobacteria bacterium]
MADRPPLLAIVNPEAGGGRCGRAAGQVLERLRARGLAVDETHTHAPGEAVEIASRAFEAGRRHFVAVGGDGTAHEVVNGIFRHPTAPEAGVHLGFLPLGTGNSFLRDFSDEGAPYAERCLAEGRTRPCDVLACEHEGGTLYFINLLSTGFVAKVNDLRQFRLRRLGEFGYVAAVVAQVAGLAAERMPILLDGELRIDDDLAFCSFNNSKFTGGKMMMAPSADPADGFIEVVVVRALPRRRLLAAFPRIFRGTHVELPEVSVHRAREVVFEMPRRQALMVDGEAVRLSPRRLGVLPGALTIYA